MRRSIQFSMCLSVFLYTASLVADTANADPKPNAERIYTERCAMCHQIGVIAPTVAQLKRLTVDEVLAALWHGTMQQHANGLTHPERLAVARFLTDDNDQQPDRSPGVVRCDNASQKTKQTGAAWPGWSPDNRLTRHVENTSITLANVKQMSLKWAHPFPTYSAFSSAGNPVAVRDGRVYTGNLNHWVYALDVDAGCAVWTFRADGRVRSNVALEGDVIVFADLNAYVYGLSAKDGSLIWKTRVDWFPGARVTGNLTLHRGVLYVPVSSLEEVAAMKMDMPCCTFRGSVVALNATDGSVRWKTYTIERYPEYLGVNEMDVPRFGPSGVPVWSGISVDDKRGVIYVGNGNQFTEPLVEESDAVMALDIATGQKRWVKNLAPEQMGSADIYHLACEAWYDPERKNCSPENPKGHGDRDIGAPPLLVTRSDGKEIIVVGSKDGMLYALDPDNQGAVMWNIRVGVGGELGGIEYGVASDGRYAYAPVVDMNADLSSNGSLTAVDLLTGKLVWRVENMDAACENKSNPACGNAVITPPTVVGEVVFVGLLDGTLRAYTTTDGSEVWRFDTAQSFAGINGLNGHGGSLGNGGPTVVDNKLYITSGFSILNVGMPGNVLLTFEIPQ